MTHERVEDPLEKNTDELLSFAEEHLSIFFVPLHPLFQPLFAKL